MKKKIYLYFRLVGIEVDLINYHFKLEFVNYGLYFVQDDFINPSLQVGSGSGMPKITGSGSSSLVLLKSDLDQGYF